MSDVVTGYLLLGLRFGRLVDGYVDAWTGDAALARQVAGEPRPDPADLARQARELSAALPDAGLSAERSRFLAGQLRALACAGHRLAGAPMAFRAELEEYFDVAVGPADPGRYEDLHDQLGRLLPGRSPLRERLVRYRDSLVVPPDLLGPAVHAVSAALRARAGGWLDLPTAERIDYVLERDRPWNAFNEYLGGYRSRITLNVDARHWASGLAIVTTHEAYPGHHAEHCLKESGLVRGRGWTEHTIALVNTPQCLVAEGTGEQGLAAALGPGWGHWVEEVLRPLGIRFDGDLAERIDGVMQALTDARQDAALLLHDTRVHVDEVTAFLSRWMLVDEERAAHAVRFLADPLWRAYTTTYVAGRRLVGEWLADRPASVPVADRYRELLAGQLLPGDLTSARH